MIDLGRENKHECRDLTPGAAYASIFAIWIKIA
jgi:hypothetical protein